MTRPKRHRCRVGIASVLRRYHVGAPVRWFAVCATVATVAFGRRLCLGLAGLCLPTVVMATDYFGPWFAMLDVCEAVVAEQSDAPLDPYAPAPFSFGKPGEKQLSFYGPNEDLVLSAKMEREIWTECSIRERLGVVTTPAGQAIIEDWAAVFETRFRQAGYLSKNHRLLAPGRINPVAVKCEGTVPSYFISASYGLRPQPAYGERSPSTDLVLSIGVARADPSADFCESEQKG